MNKKQPAMLGLAATALLAALLGRLATAGAKPLAHAALLPAPSPTPVTVTFQQGVFPSASYRGASDAELREFSPTANVGGTGTLTVDGFDSAGKKRHVLLRWDIRSLPQNCATITGASVAVSVTNASADAYEVYEVRAPWAEDQATWHERLNGTPWQIAGALGEQDSGSRSLATVRAAITGRQRIGLNAAGVTLLQAWRDGRIPNVGLGLIVRDPADDDALTFAANESPTPSLRPALTITCWP